MSEPPDLFPPEEGPELAAAEYVLGVQDADARAEARRRFEDEPTFAAHVAFWERRLAPLLAQVAEQAPSAGVWPAIDRTLGPQVIDFAVERDRRAAAAPPRTQTAKPSRWRAATVALGAVAAALALVILLPKLAPPPAAPAPTLMSARLTDPKGAALFVATLDAAHGDLVLAPASVATLVGRDPELWLIPDGGQPIAIGMARFDHPVRLPRRAATGAPGRVTLAISSEPVGGSPTGKPTGPVLASGVLERL